MSNETKHTPGPWEIGDTVNGHASSVQAPRVSTYSHLVGREVPMMVCSMGARSKDRYTEMDANARLIAAAPELLEACRAALTMCEALRSAADLLVILNAEDSLRAAIAKATGEA